MRSYKKNFSSYLVASCFLFLFFFVLANFFIFLPGYDLGAKLTYLFTRDLSTYIHERFFSWFVTPSLFAICSGFLGFICGLLGYLYNNDSGLYRHGEEYGSARLATLNEMEKYRDNQPENNMILSKHVHVSLFNHHLPIPLQKNKNVVVIGDSGSAKTLAYIKTNLMQTNASFIVTDPDGGIVHEVGTLLKKEGYTIKILDLNTLKNTDSFNVFHYIRTELDVDRVLEAITESTKKSDHQGEEFWIKAEALLIRSFIAFLWFDGKKHHYTPHLGMIADMLRLTERQNPKEPSPVEKWFEELNQELPNNYAYKQWTLFNDLYKAETRMSVLAAAAGRYSVFDHEEVVDMIREDTMSIERWNEEKTAVFLAIPETNDAYNFISALFLATIAETLRFKSDQVRLGKQSIERGNHLLHVRFLIDEFANIGRIPHFEKLLTTFRKREMSFTIVLQSLNQLQAMYKNTWETILNGCASLLFLGGDEEKTTKYLAQRIGKQTISLRKQSVTHGKTGGGSENRDRTGRDLLTPSEIALLGGDECLVFITKEHVFKDKKYYAFDHPKAGFLGADPLDKNWFYYKIYRNEVEELLDQVKIENVIDHGTLSIE